MSIYLICAGTSTYDIINSVNCLNKNTSSIFSINSNKIKKEQLSKLEDIGIKEIYTCQQNNKIANILSRCKQIYTSLDCSSIENGFILAKATNKILYPIPYASDEKIENKKIFDIFKKRFGPYELDIKNHKEITHMNNYWTNIGISNNTSNLKKTNIDINWEKVYNTDSNIQFNYSKIYNKNPSILTYSYTKFYKTLCDLFNENKNKKTPIIIVCNGNIIEDILKKCKLLKYNKSYDIIERSSVWEILLDTEQKTKDIIFNKFTKIYPDQHDKSKVIYQENSLTYKYKNMNYILFNSLKHIPLEYLKSLKLYRHSSEQQKLIKTILKTYNITTTNNKPFKETIKFENLK